jgi:hypothetical protein
LKQVFENLPYPDYLVAVVKVNKGNRDVHGWNLYANLDKTSRHYAHVHARKGNTELAVYDFSGILLARSKGSSPRDVEDVGKWVRDHHNEIIVVWRKLVKI